MDVKDKVIVITGGASGIGRALGDCFYKAGARVVVLADIDEAGAKAAAASYGAKGLGVALDVRDEVAVRALVADVEARFGTVDLYVSNAGILYSDAPDWSSFGLSDEKWQKIWEVNVKSHVLACRAVLPQMIERGEGGFLITASAAGLLTQIGDASYSTTKHAAVGFAESLAITHGDDGIYVGVLCPQAVESEMSRGAEATSAAYDGIMPADIMAERTLAAMRAGEFMIRPHDTVEGYFKAKAENYDGWLSAMQHIRRRQLAKTGKPL